MFRQVGQLQYWVLPHSAGMEFATRIMMAFVMLSNILMNGFTFDTFMFTISQSMY
jgi:hypothetical protein